MKKCQGKDLCLHESSEFLCFKKKRLANVVNGRRLLKVPEKFVQFFRPIRRLRTSNNLSCI